MQEVHVHPGKLQALEASLQGRGQGGFSKPPRQGEELCQHHGRGG